MEPCGPGTIRARLGNHSDPFPDGWRRRKLDGGTQRLTLVEESHGIRTDLERVTSPGLTTQADAVWVDRDHLLESTTSLRTAPESETSRTVAWPEVNTDPSGR